MKLQCLFAAGLRAACVAAVVPALVAGCSSPDGDVVVVTDTSSAGSVVAGAGDVVLVGPTPRAGAHLLWWNEGVRRYDVTSIDALNRRELELRDWYYRFKAVREGNIALASALYFWRVEPVERNAEQVAKALDDYRDAAMGPYGTKIERTLVLSPGISVASLIHVLTDEEKVIKNEMTRLQDERTSVIGMVAARKLYQVDRSVGTQALVKKAEDALARARDGAER